MAKRGRPPVLDKTKKGQIIKLLSVGFSRRAAADYVGCAVSTIRNTAGRDPQFAEHLRRAEGALEIRCLGLIQNAAGKERYWRAAAWALERKKPQEYAPRGPDVVTVGQIREVLGRLAEIVVEEVPAARYRKTMIKRIDRLIGSLRRQVTEETGNDPR